MKGIPFRPELIKAIEEGRKTITRRPLNPQPLDIITDKTHGNKFVVRELAGKRCWCAKYNENPTRGKMIYSRYQIGEVVYIKEAHFIGGIKPNEWVRFKDSKPLPVPKTKIEDYVWRSPLFMPERFARHFIKILDVRPERLREITESQCVKEGSPIPFEGTIGNAIEQINWFSNLWDSINKNQEWESNPFVWVYSFQKVVK